jgi:DNA-binding YbaB/EbfC family protein
MFKNFHHLLKQAQDLQTKMEDVKNKMKETIYQGSAGGDMVQISIDGNGRTHNIKIDPSIVRVEEKEMLEDLIIAAYNDAHEKMTKDTSEQMNQATGGLALPGGLKFPF